jgi:NAD(P)-dependent dehydrogenase (short-subunit alcohol dehydrogenase family)
MATTSDGDTDHNPVPAVLAGRVVVVTGASRGLGRDLALGLADAGAAVGVVDRAATGPVAQAITDAGGRAVAVDTSVEALAETSDAFATVAGALGPLDTVVHASVDPDALVPGALADVADSDWDTRCEAPLRAALACAQAAFTQLQDRGGRLVFVTPTVALTGAAGLVPYTTALEGIRALAKSAARQWGRHAITVNCVAPPLELLAADGRGAPEPTVGDPALGRAPDGRTDLAPVVPWLAGPGAGFVTGLTVTVDGGIVMAP